MSSYPGPIAILPIFISQEFNYSSSSLSISTADKRYLQLRGGILSGLLTANGGLSTSTIYNGAGTLTLPTSTDTLVGRATTDILSNKTISASSIYTNTSFSPIADPTIQIAMSASNMASGSQFILRPTASTSGVKICFVPDITSDTLCTIAANQTLTNKTLSTGTKFGSGKGIIWMDSGTSSTIASIASGNGTGSATITFNTSAPTTTGMIVLVTCTSGVGLDKLTFSTYSYSTSGAIIAVANPSSSTATSISFQWIAFVTA